MGRAERAKGVGGELEIVDMLRAAGWVRAHRNFSSGAQGGGDIARGPAGVGLEVKRQETTKIWEWMAQAEKDAAGTRDIPVVVFRRSRSGWLACLPADELLALLAHREFS